MSRRPRLGLLLAAGMAAIIVIVGCGGPAPTTGPDATSLPGPTASTAFPTAPPSSGPFEKMAYPVQGPAPCEEPASDDPAYGPYEGTLRRVFARDPLTVVFELCDADAAFLAKIASPALAIDDTAWLQSRLDPELDQPRILTEANGTGPFRLDGWDGNDDITLTRFDDYWGAPARTPSVIFVAEGDAGQRLSKLREGSVDAVDLVAAGDVEAVQGNPDLTLTPREGLNVAYIGVDNRFAPYDNEIVRRAIGIGIDRTALVEGTFPRGSIVAQYFVPCAIPIGCSGEPWPEADQEAARDLLADMGFADGFTTTISFPQEPRDYLPDPNATAIALQTQLKERLGITATLRPMPFADLVTAADAGKLDGLYLLGARARYPDPSVLLESHFGPGASLQFGNRFEDIRRYLVRARDGDQKVRAQAYKSVNVLLRQHVPMIPLAHVGSDAAFRTDVDGKQASPTSTERFVSILPGDRSQFVYMQHQRPGSLFCADETDDVALRVCAQVSESLYRHDSPDPGIVPSLAKACVPDENLIVWTCTLREGIRFHDGSGLDANDVVLSYAIRWDAAHPLHRGRQGTFQAFIDRFGGFLHPPAEP